MSLRLRLILGLVALVAAGLLLAAAVTYVSLRSFLYDRVDEQVLDARTAVAVALLTRREQPFPTGRLAQTLLPPNTYGELRDEDGLTLRSVSFTYGGTAASPPDLPSRLKVSLTSSTDTRYGPPQLSSADSKNGSGSGYRVLVQALPRGTGSLVVAVPLAEAARTLHRLLWIEVLVMIAVLLALAVLAWELVRRGLRPLEDMGRTAGAIAAGDLSRRVEPAEPRTEVGRLGLALNAMLTQIEDAFAERRASEERLRRFLASASHELRTPLTSIRGYSELFRRGADRRPEDLAVAMRRIEQEAARMGVLVDDLLLLARVGDERPLELERLDLGALVLDAVTDTRAAHPHRDIVLETEPCVVMGDDGRLREVVANLLSNAVTHTPASAQVRVSLRVEDEQATLAVADDGPGLSAEQAARVFEPFYRADQSRSRHTGGTGLGLAIVAAVVEAHGGSVEVRSMPGDGAVFRVRLPLIEHRASNAVPIGDDTFDRA